MTDRVYGTKLSERGKVLKRYTSGRVCAKRSCITVLSTYNKDDFCWFHQPIKRPRLRGRMPSELMEDSEKKTRCSSCAQKNRWLRHKTNLERREVVVEGVIHREGKNGAATLCEGL